MKLEERVLRWVNEIRTEHELKPLKRLNKGRRTSPHRCALANSLKADHVSQSWIVLDSASDPGDGIHPPQFVNQFIVNFDRGRYPHLVVNESRRSNQKEPTQ